MDRWGEVCQGLEQNRKMPHLTLGLTVSWDVTRRELSVIAERLLKQLQGPRYEVAVAVGVLTWASPLDIWSVHGARVFFFFHGLDMDTRDKEESRSRVVLRLPA